jgi:hypothetical protein
MTERFFRGCISDSTDMRKEMRNCENKVSVPWHIRGAGYYCIDLCKKIEKCPYQIEINVKDD